jgi:hypothetical protein
MTPSTILRQSTSLPPPGEEKSVLKRKNCEDIQFNKSHPFRTKIIV